MARPLKLNWWGWLSFVWLKVITSIRLGMTHSERHLARDTNEMHGSSHMSELAVFAGEQPDNSNSRPHSRLGLKKVTYGLVMTTAIAAQADEKALLRSRSRERENGDACFLERTTVQEISL
jgi:hypothetical protein